jgi:hypothetical protein
VVLMGRGRLLQSLGLRILLVALALQAVTPDPYDLVSVNTLRLFCPFLADSDFRLEDEMPDDVCEPRPSDSNCVLRQYAAADFLPFATLAPSISDLVTSASETHQLGAPPGATALPERLIHSLCRLRC